MTAIGHSLKRPGTNFLQLAGLLTSVMLVHAGAAEAIKPAGATAAPAATEAEAPAFTAEEDASYERGTLAYNQLCYVCHGKDGKGAPIPDDPEERKMAPPLSGSRRVLGRPEYVITALLYGITGPVDGQNFEGLMVPLGSYSDTWIADAASYIRNSFDNSASMITSNQVATIRAAIGTRGEPFTIPQLLTMLPVALTNQAGWKATASHSPDSARNAIDGASRKAAWSSGAPQAPGMWFQIELPEPVSIYEINLDSAGGSTGAAAGFPRGYKVQSSMDGSEWSHVADGQGKGPGIAASFDPVRAKFVRVTLTATNAAPWTISRTGILQAGQPAPEPTGDAPGNKFE